MDTYVLHDLHCTAIPNCSCNGVLLPISLPLYNGGVRITQHVALSHKVKLQKSMLLLCRRSALWSDLARRRG